MSPRLNPLRTLWTRFQLRRCSRVGPGAQVLGRVWVHGDGQVEVGAGTLLDGRAAPIELHAQAGARLILAEDVHMEGGSSIEAQRDIRIGARCRIGAFSKILDGHFHPLRGDRHARPAAGEVVLEEEVHIEARAILLPGARVERGARVCAGAVVSRRVPAGMVVSGFPATRRTGEDENRG